MVDHRSDPSALRFLIGHDLRAARERAGLKQAEAGKALGCSQAKINYLETGKTQQKPDEVATLLRAYGAEVEHVDRMTSLAARADQSTWWAPFDDVLPNWFKTFVGLEGIASAESTYSSLLLPGQLQTAEYAAALLQGNLRVPPMDAPQVVRARMARQRLTDDTNPLSFRGIIEEYALDRIVGSPQVMRAQLEHLLDLMRRDNVELHVMPVSVSVHDGLDGDFLLLDFTEAQSIGYIEYPTGAIYVQDQDQVAAYNLSADRLCAAALSVSDSADAISARIATLTTSSED
ncbi:Helix-turn-helix domain-containing protein [Saccharopolyspora antimicrobica]|uniref:Helix-turn-helix domain-containing protein n=1 Tax=Saccharopolyspora antimicrobica TaxID=455193 RepID=A0A1I5GZ04_9PSEU|nr:helix-turn-helix transcriptional regulator [Saccharopolyspora antimicrobica]RKT89279.1 helix-turn-helix protein [Saccharopolyspora antimicrobica]SFO41187.1 Helix-turn-helix domain-containing protein [Saccharopolyspora antimicrobica]